MPTRSISALTANNVSWWTVIGIGIVFFLPIQSHAGQILDIVDTPQDRDGPFIHNVFHSASSNGGKSGQILAWFDLNRSDNIMDSFEPGSNSNSSAGLRGSFNIYNYNGNYTNKLIGTVIVESGTSFIDTDPLSDNINTDVLVGSIRWVFNLNENIATKTRLWKHLDNVDNRIDDDGNAIVTVSYADRIYVPNATYVPNTWKDGFLSLWGSSGNYRGNGNFSTRNSPIGTDVVLQTTPTPSAIILMASGILIMAGWGTIRRKRLSKIAGALNTIS